MEYISYHIEVTSDGQQVHITARHPDETKVGQPRGPFGLYRVRDEVFALAEKVAQETASRQDIERLGERLFHALFCDRAVGEHFRNTFRRARERRQGLRLELDLDETQMPEVAALPWEFLRAPETPGYPSITLATDPNLALSRRRSLWESPSRVAKAGPLRILLALASPDEAQLGPVAYEEVLQELRTLTQRLVARFEPLEEPLCNVDSLKLDRALGSKPDILHFIGHGRFIPDPADPHGELAMVGAGGWTEWRRDVDFASVLERHMPSVVFLQACEGGKSSSARGLVGVASKVVQLNAPVVVAMQYPISNAAALVFACRFYERLAAGDPVDKAAQEGRRALWYKFIGRREFATPVLYMRSPDGRIFDIERSAQPSLEQVSKGMVALAELMQLPEVQDAVIAFRADFQAACEQINRLGHFKQLHDLFQELESLYSIIADERRRLAANQVAWEALMLHEPDLQGVIVSILKVARTVFVADNAWWMQQLSQAQAELRAAMESFDPRQIDSAARRLSRILDREPSRINTRLVATTRSLRLAGLVRAMATVQDSLVRPELDWEAVHRFTDGVEALTELDGRLGNLVSEHDRWQEINDELRRVEANLDQGLVELELAWPDLKTMTHALCNNRTADWAISLREVCTELERALTTESPVRTKMLFFRCRSQASRHFRKVDSDLLTLCHNLQKVGESLDLLMRTM